MLEAAAEHKEVQKVLRTVTLSFFVMCLCIYLMRLTHVIQGREKKANKFEQSGLTLEELERIQREQFADAAARHT